MGWCGVVLSLRFGLSCLAGLFLLGLRFWVLWAIVVSPVVLVGVVFWAGNGLLVWWDFLLVLLIVRWCLALVVLGGDG